ncbi:hypothetical protein P7K49_027449 [Saguinus oedipus]|uniref:Uncharacterized protein n=1 Tax=Saguinus oedipus TaxID=9490 RepID=A0ABQ9U9X2_SAGOE|nr:hypothetical protein P7K49_027449 [Saguinus oedipus]
MLPQAGTSALGTYELNAVLRRKGRGPRGEGLQRGPIWVPATYTFTVRLALSLRRWNTLGGPQGAVASTWRGRSRDRSWDAPAAPTCSTELLGPAATVTRELRLGG